MERVHKKERNEGMFFKILRRDLKRKKGMNLILFLFIVIASTFMSSSMNNLFTITNALDHFMEKSNTSDYLLISMFEEKNSQMIESWLKESKCVDFYEKEETCYLSNTNFILQSSEEYETNNLLSMGKEPNVHNLVFDEQGNKLQLKTGEIAVPVVEAEKNKIKIGDKITIVIEGKKKELKVTSFIKDMALGSELIGMKRYIISQEDYQDFLKSASKKIELYSIKGSIKLLEKELNQQNFSVLFNASSETIKMTYVMDMLIAGILIVFSICLIFISLLILRFTIVFTLQEDYKEIGIMKAIGIKNKGIKRIYLIKYLSMSVIGAFLGTVFSIPLSEILLKEVAKNIDIKTGNMVFVINIVCAIMIICIVVGFCYLSTGKVNRFTAIDAIRNGSTGERYRAKNKIKLHKTKRISTECYMAINDIFSNIKRYVVLMITFFIGTLLIILPINSINTLKSDDLVNLFALSKSDVFINSWNDGMGDSVSNSSEKSMLHTIEKIEKIYKEKGIELDIFMELTYDARVYVKDVEDSVRIFSVQRAGESKLDYSEYDYLEGSYPYVSNEVAMTKVTAESLGVAIGDMIHIQIGDKKYDCIISGIFQSMNSFGQMLRFSDKMDIDVSLSSGTYATQGNFVAIDTEKEKKEAIEQMKQITPEQEILTSIQFVSGMIGNIPEQMNKIKNIILFIVLGIHALVTLLVMKMFLTREKGEIAMIKSIGFNSYAIKKWQVLRISIVLCIAIIMACVLSKSIGIVTVGQIFKIMGATNIELKVIPIQIYFYYPVLLLIVISLAALVSTSMIKKISIRDTQYE